MESRETKTIKAINLYADAIKDLPQYKQALVAVAHMLDNVVSGMPEDDILAELKAMFPTESVEQHLAAMQEYMGVLLDALISQQ